MRKKTYTFAAWLDRYYRKRGESKTASVYRFAAEYGMAMPSIWYATEGCRVGPRLAQRIEEITEGRVSVASLVVGMTRDELKRRRKEERQEVAQ